METIQNFVDAHCHVDLFQNPVEFALSCQTSNTHTIAVTNAPSVFFYTDKLSKDNDFLYPAIGLHPELCQTHKSEISTLLQMISRVRYVGEVGLDYVEQNAEIQASQRDVFNQILHKCAEVRGRILSVHSRRAASDTISMIGSKFPGRIILHWFSGNIRDLRRGVENGYYFSVNCAMANSDNGKRILKELPMDRVITESDSPFQRCCTGKNRSRAYHAIHHLSSQWGCSFDEAAATIYNNFKNIVST